MPEVALASPTLVDNFLSFGDSIASDNRPSFSDGTNEVGKPCICEP